MTSRNRYYINLERTEEDEQKKGEAALQWLVQQMNESYEDGVIAAHRQKLAESVAEGIGKGLIDQLTQSSEHSVDTEYGTLHLVTNRIDPPVPPSRMEGPAIIVDPNEKIINKIEEDSYVEDICLINWPLSDATTAWIEEHSPRQLTVQE